MTLTIDDFLELLDFYGSDLDSWPLSEAEVAAVALLLTQSDFARDAVIEMRGLEVHLRRPPRAPESLADRILTAAGAGTANPICVRSEAAPAEDHPADDSGWPWTSDGFRWEN
ncbi:MAG: hypothetical protein NVV74_25350 [Magnetospirillum sp.]|nr:hypothetical protein [Magnetospirillum sp.]